MTSNTPPTHPTPDPQDPKNTNGQPTSPGATPSEEKTAKLDLSVTQIVGGALAAVTAAALGSTLGVAGTLGGAAVASIVAGVAGSLYTASLRRTQEKVKTVWSGRVAGTETPAAVDRVPDAPVWELPTAPPTATIPPSPRGRLPWKAMLAGAAAAFAIAIIALTGFELLSGSAISGGKGTTIGQASEPRSAHSTESKKPKATPTPSASESSTPSVAPSDPESTPSGTPSAEAPSPSASEAPSESSSSETQSESPSPSDGAPSQGAGQAPGSAPSETPDASTPAG